MPKFSEFFFGEKDKIKTAPTQSKDQQALMKLINDALIKGEGPLADVFGEFNEEEFQEGVAKPQLKQFQEEILPMLQEKFIAGNQVGGSGMRNAGIKAGVDFQSKLAQLLYEAKQGHKQNQIAGLNTGLGTQTTENFYKQGKGGVAAPLVQGVAQAATSAKLGPKAAVAG